MSFVHLVHVFLKSECDIWRKDSNRYADARLKVLFGDADFDVVDEAQRTKDIGLTAKLIHDTFPVVKLLLTGSSSIGLANTVEEPLTGRSGEYISHQQRWLKTLSRQRACWRRV